MKYKYLAVAVAACLSLSACVTPQATLTDKKLTLGVVQQSIKQGVSSIKVLETLGSPNIVKTAADSNNEVWIYDKIYHSESRSSLALLLGGGDNGFGGGTGLSNTSSESSSKSLTVIIKFDEQDMIKSVSYLSSSF